MASHPSLPIDCRPGSLSPARPTPALGGPLVTGAGRRRRPAAPLAAAAPDPALRRAACRARRTGAAVGQDPHHLPDARLLDTAHRVLPPAPRRRRAALRDDAAAAGAAERFPSARLGAARRAAPAGAAGRRRLRLPARAVADARALQPYRA